VRKKPVSAYQQHVHNFKRQLLRATLEAHGGNRTHAARALGLQRTYLIRLIRDLQVTRPKEIRPQAREPRARSA
jgi:DNA-binding NtrC family response regulator